MAPEAIRNVMKRYVQMMCESDADGILRLYADDATVEDPVGAKLIQGRQALHAFYAATTPHLRVELTGPVCVAGRECAAPLLAELTTSDKTLYIDVIDVMKFDDEGKITSMRAFWSPQDMRPTR